MIITDLDFLDEAAKGKSVRGGASTSTTAGATAKPKFSHAGADAVAVGEYTLSQATTKTGVYSRAKISAGYAVGQSVAVAVTNTDVSISQSLDIDVSIDIDL